MSLPARLEAILYLKGRPLSLQELSSLVGLSESETEQGMLILIAGYAQRDTSLEIHQGNGRYSLQLRPGLGAVSYTHLTLPTTWSV